MTKIIFGPYHPAYKEPIGLVLEVEGEKVVDAKISIGYAHRSVERILENSKWISGMIVASRVCGICSSVHCSTYCFAVEKMFGVEIPERAKFLRMIFLELERLHSHLLWLAFLFHEIGFDTPFMHILEDREKLLQLIEEIAGRRVIWMVSIPGGVRRDLKGNHIKKIKKLLDFLEKRLKVYENLIKEKTVIVRLREVGILNKKIAKEFGCVGPVARASGLRCDIRYENPYYFYSYSPFNIQLGTKGDCYERLVVRLKEMKNSIEIIKWCIEEMTPGPISEKIHPLSAPAEGEAISRHEAPRGELFYYLKSSGGETPEKVRIRTPTFANIFSLATLLKDCYLADVPAIVFSFDPCVACMDRTLILDRSKNKTFIWDKHQFILFSRRWYKKNYKLVEKERL